MTDNRFPRGFSEAEAARPLSEGGRETTPRTLNRVANALGELYQAIGAAQLDPVLSSEPAR